MDNTFIAEYLGTVPRTSRLLDFTDKVLRRTMPWIRVASAWRGQMASVESRMNLFHLLSQVIAFRVPGEIVEIGCHAGESTVVLQRILQELDPSRELHAFDSFCGVPPGEAADENVYQPGDMSASLTQFTANFDRLQLKRPAVHPGWFKDTLPGRLPQQIAFALVDADLYQSTLLALQSVYPRMSPNAICLLGVYWHPRIAVALTTDRKYRSPGVKQACDEFFADKGERVDVLLAGNYTSGYFRKQ